MYRGSLMSLTTAATALLLLTGTTHNAAYALSDTDSSAEVLEAVVPQVAAESAAVSTTSDADSALQTDEAGIQLEVPRDLEQGLTVDAPGTAHDLQVTVAGAEGAGTAQPAGEGGVVIYPDTAPSADTVAQVLPNGVRFMSVINRPDAPDEYRYDLGLPDGAKVLPNDAGGLAITNAQGEPLYSVDAPWAVDANDQQLPTSYAVEGNVLVQRLDHSGAAYPVVADPKVTYGWYIYVRWNKTETRNVANLNRTAVAATLLGAGCGKVPGWIASTACGVAVTLVVGAIHNSFQAAARENKCHEVRFDYDGSLAGWKRYAC